MTNNVILHPLQLNELEALILNQVRKALAEIKLPAPPAKDEIITIDEAAKILHLTTATIYGLVHKKQLPVMKRRGRLYFSRHELEIWIKNSRVMTNDELKEATLQSLTR